MRKIVYHGQPTPLSQDPDSLRNQEDNSVDRLCSLARSYESSVSDHQNIVTSSSAGIFFFFFFGVLMNIYAFDHTQ